MNQGRSAILMKSSWSPVSLLLFLLLWQVLVLFVKGFLYASVCVCFSHLVFANPLCSVVFIWRPVHL